MPEYKYNPYDEGYEAGFQLRPNTVNPHTKDTKEFDQWLDGWVDGRTARDRADKSLLPIKPQEYYN